MFKEGKDYKWANKFDKYITKWLPFWYWRKAILLKSHFFVIKSEKCCHDKFVTDELKDCSCVFYVPAGTTWNGPSIGIAYEKLMLATLEHDIPYRWHKRKGYEELTRKEVDEHFIKKLVEVNCSSWYIKAIRSKPVQKLFDWAWKNNLG